MIKRQSIRLGHHKAGKSFVLMFNRISMYGVGHPFSVQAVEEFHRSICDLLKMTSPVVLLFSRGQFFLEDEPLDPSLNYLKMASHFTKAKVSSIDVIREVEIREIEDFVRIFLDTRKYPTADQMKAAVGALQITHIRINHVSYKKVTEDDQIVSKSTASKSAALSDELDASRQYQEALGMIAGKLLLEEVDQGLSVKRLMADPVGFSKHMLAKGVAESSGEVAAGPPPACAISAQLATLGREIRKVVSDSSALQLSELAAAVVKMRHELQEAIQTQKSLGVLLDPADDVRQQAEELADSVLLELIKKEYAKGKTPIERLAFVLQRLVTPSEELRRLLPKIRDSLLSGGMPLSDFWELIKHMGRDSQSGELVEWVNQGAESIGVDGAELLDRWKADPSGLARILYLATEIDRKSGSTKPLCDILVDYVERFGPKMLTIGSNPEGASNERLRTLAFFFNSRLVEGLRGEGVDPHLVGQVETRLKERLDASVAAIRAEFAAYRASLNTQDQHQGTLLQRLEAGLSGDQELKQILQEVRANAGEKRLDENDFQQIFERIQQVKQERLRAGVTIRDLVFNRKFTHELLEKEISRAARYGTDLSGITFSLLGTGSQAAVPQGAAVPMDAAVAALLEIKQLLRRADWMGTLKRDLFIAVLPMTTAKEAHLTARRLLKRVNAKPDGASGAALPVKVAGAVIHYEKQTIANADAFVRCACSEHAEMTHRLRNLQEFM